MSSKTGFIIGAVGLLAVGAVLWTVAIMANLKRTPKATAQVTDSSNNVDRLKPAPSPQPSVVTKEQAKGLITLGYKWTKDGFGTIMMVDFTLTNRSPFDAKDITVTCTHYAPSGTEIDSNTRTIYEVVPAHGKKVIKDFNMGFIHSQAASTSCRIDDLDVL